MLDIEKIDANFVYAKLENEDEYDFYPAHLPPFKIYGMEKQEDGYFRRIPDDIAKDVNSGVRSSCQHTSGGRFIFKTNAPKLALKTTMPLGLSRGPTCTPVASIGMDIYRRDGKKQMFLSSFKPMNDAKAEGWTAESKLWSDEEKEIIIYTSYFGCMKDILIGVPKGCYIKEAGFYTYEKPIVFYGSSITHGCCAQRAGLTYPNLISQHFDTNIINHGYSGSAKGEETMARYLAGLDMSIFVYDYDHNAPTPEHLKETHEPFYKIVREKHPDIPVIMMSRPQWHEIGDKAAEERFNIIKETYDNAKARGENVYILDGRHFYDKIGYQNGCMDASHPTTLGFLAMADAVISLIEKENLLNKKD